MKVINEDQIAIELTTTRFSRDINGRVTGDEVHYSIDNQLSQKQAGRDANVWHPQSNFTGPNAII